MNISVCESNQHCKLNLSVSGCFYKLIHFLKSPEIRVEHLFFFHPERKCVKKKNARRRETKVPRLCRNASLATYKSEILNFPPVCAWHGLHFLTPIWYLQSHFTKLISTWNQWALIINHRFLGRITDWHTRRLFNILSFQFFLLFKAVPFPGSPYFLQYSSLLSFFARCLSSSCYSLRLIFL